MELEYQLIIIGTFFSCLSLKDSNHKSSFTKVADEVNLHRHVNHLKINLVRLQIHNNQEKRTREIRKAKVVWSGPDGAPHSRELNTVPELFAGP